MPLSARRQEAIVRAFSRPLPFLTTKGTSMSTATPPAAPETDRFQSREELVQYIEQQTAAAVEKAVGSGQVSLERRVPWVTSGPVGQDSAGYSVLKAAAFAMGFIGPEQAKEEVHVHQQLRELYKTYRSEEHTSELQSLTNLVCRLLLEK